ncbi:CheR family methyltransferase [Novosphingobium sp.]|uniref:CheR family methyltransferase n=1 Tax=Novosphingobium sp. TaxID=1874826 RepID=UPI0026206542|nr:CheR family methyltransferase [Novosphingobium sp.]
MNLTAAFSDGCLPGVSPDVYSDADFRAIADMIYAESGNVLPQGKAMLVYSRIAPLVRKSGKQSFADYIELIRNDPDLRKSAVDALTTNHTFFFREGHHFRHFADHVRPHLVEQLEAGGRARLWSAGCSSGEETWSLVLTLLGEDRSQGLRLLKRDVVLLASDLAAHVLRKAEAAAYAASEIRDLPPKLQANWLKTAGDSLVVNDEARAIVRFRELNLLGPWPMRQQFDVIFCRNVMIYFDLETKERLVERFVEQLKPGGYLYIGHSERVSGPAVDRIQCVGPTIYRKRAA